MKYRFVAARNVSRSSQQESYHSTFGRAVRNVYRSPLDHSTGISYPLIVGSATLRSARIYTTMSVPRREGIIKESLEILENLEINKETSLEELVHEWASALGVPQTWSVWQSSIAAMRRKFMAAGNRNFPEIAANEYSTYMSHMRTEVYTELFGPDFAKFVVRSTKGGIEALPATQTGLMGPGGLALRAGPAPGPAPAGTARRTWIPGGDGGSAVSGTKGIKVQERSRPGMEGTQLALFRSPLDPRSRRQSPEAVRRAASVRTAPGDVTVGVNRPLAFSLNDPGSDKAVSETAAQGPGDQGFEAITRAAVESLDALPPAESETSDQCMNRLTKVVDALESQGFTKNEVEAVVDLEWYSHTVIEKWREACEVGSSPKPIREWAKKALSRLQNDTEGAANRRDLEIQVRALGRWAGLTHFQQTHNIGHIWFDIQEQLEDAVSEQFRTPYAWTGRERLCGGRRGKFPS